MHVNSDYQKNSNMSRIFETVWRNPGFSRIDIAHSLGLYRSTVSNIIGTLIEKNIIYEGERGNATDKGGRKPVLLSLNKDFGCIIGIEIQLDFYRLSVLSFAGEELLSHTGKTPFNKNLFSCPEECFTDIVDHIIALHLNEINFLRVRPLGLCLAIPGIIDIDRGVIINSAPFRLKNFNYGEKLGRRYGLPLFIENDAKCCSWLQLAANRTSGKRDFICVLARNYTGNEELNYPESYGTGIGTGLSITMNGRVVNGRNYAVGEYISYSWRGYEKGQTGLPQAVIKTLNTIDDSYREWVKDLFSTLTPIVPLLEPEIIFLHGQPESKKDLILQTIKQDVPQFTKILDASGCSLQVLDEDKYEISRGAACMFFQKLFETQMLETGSSYSHIEWEELFALYDRSLEKSLLNSPA